MTKFLRIINSSEYEKYLCESIYKYIPKNILYMLQKKIKHRVVCKYIEKESKKEVGYGVGILLNIKNLTREQYMENIINSINKLTDQEQFKGVDNLCIDNLNLNHTEMDTIQRNCNIKILSGKGIFIDCLIQLVNKICNARCENIQQQEILILSDDTKETEGIAIDISSKIKFLSIYTHNEVFSKGLEQKILEKTGLSLHTTNNIDKLIGSFDFIINLSEDINININKIKRNAVVIDLSKNKGLYNKIYKGRKNLILIDDIYFKNDRNIYCSRIDCDFPENIDTSLSGLLKNSNKDIVKIKIYDKIYNVKEGINSYSFQNFNTSSFNKRQ